MMKRILATAAVLLLSATPLVAQNEDEQAVLRTVHRLFEGMRLADTMIVRSVFHPEARLITTGMRDGSPVASVVPIAGFVQAVGGAKEVWDEQIFDPEVRIEDNLASVWTQYTFHAGGRFSHCGVDAMQLVRTPAGWRIIQIADTRRTERCATLLERQDGAAGDSVGAASDPPRR